MTWNIFADVRYGARSFLRAPLAGTTIVITIGLGLGLAAAVFTIVSSMIFSEDEVRNPHELFGVERQRSAFSEPEAFAREEYETLLRETDIFADAFASTSDVAAWIDGVRREGRLVTGNFFQVLGVSAALGRVFAPPEDEAGSPPVIVLSYRAWVQHYAADRGVLDRAVRVNGTMFRIIGVTPRAFRGLEVVAAPDFWVPLAHGDLFGNRRFGEQTGVDAGLSVVGRLLPDLRREQAAAQLNAWRLQRAAARSAERPASLLLEPRRGTLPRPAEALLTFMPLFFAFGLILMIGCANVANLLLARLVKRQREIGIRLALGASRLRVVVLLFTENLLLSLVAAVLAFGVSRLALTGLVHWVTISFPPDIGNLRLAVPTADWRVALFLAIGAILSTVLFALLPAFHATRVEPSCAIRGQAIVGDARPGRTRSALIVLQVAGSALLLTCTAIFLRSAWSSAAVDPGIRTSDILTMAVSSESQRRRIVDTLSDESSVVAMAAAWPGPLGGAPAYAEGANGRSVVRYQFVSPEYFDVLGVDLIRGVGFADSERSANAAVAVVSEGVARELWPGVEPLGQVLRVEPDPAIVQPEADSRVGLPQSGDPMLRDRTAVVIGVARDVAGFQVGVTKVSGAGVYMPTSAETADTSLIVRTRGNDELAKRTLIDRFAAIDPNMVEVSTLQTLARTNTYIFGTSFWLTFALGSLALLLTVTGLFSVLSYVVEQRRQEFGVRMALGASNRGIGGLVLRQSARPVGIGLLVGGSCAAVLATLLLAMPAAEQISSIVRVFDPLAYAASLLCVVVACAGAALIPALRAASVSPLTALRQD